MEDIYLGACKMWSLQAGGLYMQVVFRAGQTLYTVFHRSLGLAQDLGFFYRTCYLN